MKKTNYPELDITEPVFSVPGEIRMGRITMKKDKIYEVGNDKIVDLRGRYCQQETSKNENKSNNMVYCCNCKYFTEGHMDYDLFAMSRSYCNSLTGLVKINPIYGAYNERINLGVSDKSYPNKKGNCKFYKRKWYKFWVK